MSFHLKNIVQKDENGVVIFQAKQIQITGEETWKLFQQLVARACNVWDQAPPEIKEFADLITIGTRLQDYKVMDQPMQKHATPHIGPDLFPGINSEDIPRCEHCNQRGVAHIFNCPALLKSNQMKKVEDKKQ